MLYFAYGSNLNHRQMKHRCSGSKFIKKFNDGRKKMAKMPRGSSLIYNPVSAAPGFIIKNVICLPGVPSILKSMIDNVKKYLVKGSVVLNKSISLYTVESNISKELTKIQNKYSKRVEIGSYPFFRAGKLGVSIVLRSTDQNKIDQCNDQILQFIKEKNIEILREL